MRPLSSRWHCFSPQASRMQTSRFVSRRRYGDAAKAHFRDGLAFFQSEQFGPAIVEFRAAWELSGERDLCTT